MDRKFTIDTGTVEFTSFGDGAGAKASGSHEVFAADPDTSSFPTLLAYSTFAAPNQPATAIQCSSCGWRLLRGERLNAIADADGCPKCKQYRLDVQGFRPLSSFPEIQISESEFPESEAES